MVGIFRRGMYSMSKSFIGPARKLLRYTKKFIKNGIVPVIDYCRNRLRFKAAADPHKVIWVNPKTIRYRLKGGVKNRKKYGMGLILDGDWDLDVEIIDPEKRPKYKGIAAHFKHGVPWEETDLFKDDFAKKIKGGDLIRGRRSIQDLLGYYNDKIDGLYYSLKENGFLLPSKEHPEIDSMYVCIGRKGELIYTDAGVHRLFIAMHLNINPIPVKIWWRHKKWQKIRDSLFSRTGENYGSLAKRFSNHPDLKDIPPSL